MYWAKGHFVVEFSKSREGGLLGVGRNYRLRSALWVDIGFITCLLAQGVL